MVLDHVENFVSSDADADIATGDTSISVADASVYPDPASVGSYNVVVDDSEVVRLTALDTGTNTLTVTRAQEGTTAQAFTSPVPIELNATRKVFRDTDSALDSVAAYSGTPPTADNLTSQLGTSSNRQDVYAGAIDAQSALIDVIGQSYRSGNTVYYDADNRGPYTDVANAAADVPDGGTLKLVRGYSVDSEGVLQLSRPISIDGMSFSQIDGTEYGTVIDNTTNVTDSPPIQIDASATAGERAVTLSNFHVKHHGPTSFGVEILGSYQNTIRNVEVECDGSGYGGFHLGEGTFSTSLHTCKSIEATDYGFLIDGGGSNFEFYDCIGTGSASGGATALETRQQGTSIFGGVMQAEDGTGIRFKNDETYTPSGGLVVGTYAEIQTANVIDIDSSVSNPFTNVRVFFPRFRLDTGAAGVQNGVRFGNCRDCSVHYPMMANYIAGGQMANWTADSQDCAIHLTPSSRFAPYTVDAGATRPSVVYPYNMTDAQVSQVVTDSNISIHVPYNQSQDSPVNWNGSNWMTAASAYSSYSP